MAGGCSSMGIPCSGSVVLFECLPFRSLLRVVEDPVGTKVCLESFRSDPIRW